ncbi:MAG: penicillin-binding protein [Mycobacteriales bacterium]
MPGKARSRSSAASGGAAGVGAAGRRRSIPASMLKMLVAAVAGGVILAGIALPTIGGLGLAARSGADTFDNLPTALRDDGQPPQRSVIVAAGGQQLANLYLQNRAVVPLAQIPEVARSALIAIEDNRFYEHHGIDMRGTLRALLADSSGGSLQGGSTLTQQYVKQVLLYSATTPEEQRAATADTIGRKLREARIAVALEHKLSKDEILARYMNIAYFGSGAYGIETAAEVYFGIPAIKLDLPQAAVLAGLVQSPTGFDPHLHMDRALARRHEVLQRMQSLGYITVAEEQAADSGPIRLAPKTAQPPNGCTQTLMANTGFFCDYVRSYLTNVLHLTQAQLYQGGLTIKTTLDATAQHNAVAALTHYVPSDNAAAAVLDLVQPGTGDIRAMAVNRKFGAAANDPSQTTINLAVKAVSQAGSTYKAFTLAAALQRHVPFTYEIKSPTPYTSPIFKGAGGKPYIVHNDVPGTCDCTLAEATVRSVNTYYVQLLESPYFAGDLAPSVSLAQQMGLSQNTLTPQLVNQVIANQQAPFTLGFPATSPLDMASAYATLAANGRYCPPDPIVSITGPDGRALSLPAQHCKQVLDPSVAVGVTSILKGVPSTSTPGSTGKAAALDVEHPAAGKTGTNNNSSSVWFAGYTPNLAGAVAVFNPNAPSRPLTTIPGIPAPVSSNLPAQMWHDALEPDVLNQPSWTWPAPDPNVVDGNAVGVPCVVGQNVTAVGAQISAAQFQQNVISQKGRRPAGTIVLQDPACGQKASPGAVITLTISDGSIKPPTTTTPSATSSPPPTTSLPPPATSLPPPASGNPPRPTPTLPLPTHPHPTHPHPTHPSSPPSPPGPPPTTPSQPIIGPGG